MQRSVQQFDEGLLLRAQRGEDAAVAKVISRMMPLIRKGAAASVAPGLDFDDAVQEGLIGLFQALRRYDAAQGTPFVSFAAACITHAQTDARRAAGRKKHAPLNTSVPLPEDSSAPGPEEQLIADESYADLLLQMEQVLSPLERQVLQENLAGHTVAQTARQLNRSAKAVENALGRARRKLRETTFSHSG